MYEDDYSLEVVEQTWRQRIDTQRCPCCGESKTTNTDGCIKKWLAKAKHINTIDPTVDLNDLFFHEIIRKVHTDSTITVNGTLYEVPSILNTRTVKLHFDPRVRHSPRFQLMFSYGFHGR